MIDRNQHNNIADNFFGMIKTLSVDVRLELISRISESLKSATDTNTENQWTQLFGAWNDNQSAEDIINDIYNSRGNNRQIEDL